MRIKNLSFGVDISDVNLSSCPNSHLKDIVDICAKERLVVLKNQEISDERFDEINEIFGIRQPANIWASHANFPKIIRVTNKEVSKGKKGFFSQKTLDWHSNSFAPDPEECVAFLCIEPGTAGGSTEFACGVHAYNNLNDEIKEEIQSADIVLTNKVGSETYLKGKSYGGIHEYERIDMEKMRSRNRYFAGGAKGNPYDEKNVHREGKNYYIRNKDRRERNASLIVKHPITGTIGLFFPVYCISQITGLKTPSRAKDIFYILMDSYVGEKGKIYKHHWQKGDLILSDQIHSLHRRHPYSGTRELYRSAFWYRTSNEKNMKEKDCRIRPYSV